MNQTNLNDKKKRLIIIISILIVFIGITLAYVVGQISSGAIGNANVTADTTDNLDFSIDKDINLNPTQFNVTVGGGGLSDTAVGTATLLANSTNDTATFDYYVYFNIRSNNYTYTTEDYKPEIVLTITDPTGQPVTEVSGLTYVTVQNADGSEVSGFDITTKSGLINIASNYEITSNSSTNATVQNWIFTVTFINLTTNQAANGGSTLDAEIILSKDVKNYHEICEPGTMACDIARLYNKENPETNGLYYHNGSITAGVNSCTYNDNPVVSYDTWNYYDVTEESCQKVYQIVYDDVGSEVTEYYDSTYDDYYSETVTVEWNSETGTCITTTDGTTVLEWDGDNATESQCVGLAYNEDGEYYIGITEVGSGIFSVENVSVDAEDYSYRYSGANPDNYVCFGTDAETCPAENLYRIIGVFDEDKDNNYQVKLIKADYVTSDMLGTNGRDYIGTYNDVTSNYKGSMDTSTIVEYSWNYDTSVSKYGSNNWATSEFNKINLNTNYWNYLGAPWQDLISPTTWHLGGMTSNSDTAKVFYDGERNNAGYGSNPTRYSAKIGIMYVSDYGYATSPENWNTSLDDYNNTTVRENNWMHMGLDEFTITPLSLNSYNVFYLGDSGYLFRNGSGRAGNSARPVFYLNSDVELNEGTGTANDPYRLVV